MNAVEYDLLKKEYDLYQMCKRDSEDINKRIEELEENETVKEYKKLIAKSDYYSQNYGSTLTNEADFINNLLSGFRIKEECNIYVEVDNNFNKKYYGENSKMFRMLERSKDSIGSETFVKEEELEEFERDNIVIYPPKDVNKDEFFKKLQYEYFKVAFEKGKDKTYKFLLESKNN